MRRSRAPIRLEVDAGEGFELRQDANTELLLLDPVALLARVGEQVRARGVRSEMPVGRRGETRHYPLAIDAEAPRLPAGSLLLTGTPAGVALGTPRPLGLLARGALRLRSPFEQFRQDELARAAAREPGGYLAPGDRVRARIAGLGTQLIRIAEPGAPVRTCAAPSQSRQTVRWPNHNSPVRETNNKLHLPSFLHRSLIGCAAPREGVPMRLVLLLLLLLAAPAGALTIQIDSVSFGAGNTADSANNASATQVLTASDSVPDIAGGPFAEVDARWLGTAFADDASRAPRPTGRSPSR